MRTSVSKEKSNKMPNRKEIFINHFPFAETHSRCIIFAPHTRTQKKRATTFLNCHEMENTIVDNIRLLIAVPLHLILFLPSASSLVSSLMISSFFSFKPAHRKGSCYMPCVRIIQVECMWRFQVAALYVFLFGVSQVSVFFFPFSLVFTVYLDSWL